MPPNSLNEVFATIAVAIAGNYCEREGMELPDDAFCRGLRAELAAVHRCTAGLAFANSKRIRFARAPPLAGVVRRRGDFPLTELLAGEFHRRAPRGCGARTRE